MDSPIKIWRQQKYHKDLLGQTGVIVSWTVIRVPPAGYESQAPYAVVLVKLASKKTVICQLADWDYQDIKEYQPVTLVIRRIRNPSTEGIIPYGIKAVYQTSSEGEKTNI